MIFSSLSFLLLFFPILTILYFTIPAKYDVIRKYVLLGFSVLFYASGEPVYIFLIFGCILGTWVLSKGIEKREIFSYVVAITLNLLPLFVFKYLNFFVNNLTLITKDVKVDLVQLSLPIGISFYTFQILAYVIDLYHGRVERQNNILFLALYIMFFPQLIAGPIVRYQEVKDSIENDRTDWDKVRYGVGRFIKGLSKKVLIANQVGFISSEIMMNPLNSISTGLLWLAVLAYTLQIYFDFSGYSDMAIGLGSIFGFVFPENFKRPYMSTSISDFWRRWHITLGSFFRDYVYIPLGGNRVKPIKWIFNVFTVWILTGLWHGAAWNFAIWGGYYAVLLVLEKGSSVLLKRFNLQVHPFIGWLLTMFFILLGWGIFMADGYCMSDLLAFIYRLFHSEILENRVTLVSMNLISYLPYVVLGVFISFPTGTAVNWMRKSLDRKKSKTVAVLHDFMLIFMLLLCIVYIVGGSYNPFIYYRF